CIARTTHACIEPSRSSDCRMRRRSCPNAKLLEEARAVSTLNHPHICMIHEVGEIDGHAFIVIEYVDGRALSELIPKGGLPLDSVLDYGGQIADALGFAHECGVVHRDFKTSNIVVTKGGRAKVLDFGLARRMPVDLAAEVTRSTTSRTAWPDFTRASSRETSRRPPTPIAHSSRAIPTPR